MKTLQITPPSGYEIDEKLSTFTNIIFKPLVIKQSAEKRMSEIWRKCNIVKYSSDNCRTYFWDKEPMFQQDWKNKKLHYRYSLIYQVFEKEYNMKEKDINFLVLSTISKYLNCNDLEGGWIGEWGVDYWRVGFN